MNDTLELWSAPWHSLQRSLAETLGIELSRLIAAAAAPHEPADTASSWLARARTPIQPVAGRGP